MKTGLLLQTCTAVEMARKMPGFARKYILSASTCPSTHLASIPAPHLRQLAIIRGPDPCLTQPPQQIHNLISKTCVNQVRQFTQMLLVLI